MTVLYSWGYRLGVFAERQKTVLLFSLFLALPVTAGTLSAFAPSLGQILFSPICHQNPERSLGTLPLCARCLGLYLGFGLGGLLFPVLPGRFPRRFLFAAIAASLSFAGMSFFTPIFDGNYMRFVLGFSVGTGFALLINSILK